MTSAWNKNVPLFKPSPAFYWIMKSHPNCSCCAASDPQKCSNVSKWLEKYKRGFSSLSHNSKLLKVTWIQKKIVTACYKRHHLTWSVLFLLLQCIHCFSNVSIVTVAHKNVKTQLYLSRVGNACTDRMQSLIRSNQTPSGVSYIHFS